MQQERGFEHLPWPEGLDEITIMPDAFELWHGLEMAPDLLYQSVNEAPRIYRQSSGASTQQGGMDLA